MDKYIINFYYSREYQGRKPKKFKEIELDFLSLPIDEQYRISNAAMEEKKEIEKLYNNR